jgi:hypothetical protein
LFVFHTVFLPNQSISPNRSSSTSGGVIKKQAWQGIFWYDQRSETGDKAILKDIVDYNEDDLRTTVYCFCWIEQNIQKPTMNTDGF